MQDLNQLLKILLQNNLDFLIVGGFAAVVHGSSHVTKDPAIGTFQELKSRAEVVDLYGYNCHVLSLDDLISVKKRMTRPKDLIVLEELLALKSQKSQT